MPTAVGRPPPASVHASPLVRPSPCGYWLLQQLHIGGLCPIDGEDLSTGTRSLSSDGKQETEVERRRLGPVISHGQLSRRAPNIPHVSSWQSNLNFPAKLSSSQERPLTWTLRSTAITLWLPRPPWSDRTQYRNSIKTMT